MILRFEVSYLYDAMRTVVTHAADEFSMRPHLAQIHFAPTVAGGVSITTTDGKRLAFWNAGGNGGYVDDDRRAAGIGKRDAKSLIAFLKPHTKTDRPHIVTFVDLDFGRGVASVDPERDGGAKFVHAFVPVLGAFPPAQQVIPKVADQTKPGELRHFSMSPTFMIEAAKAFEIAGGSFLPVVQVFTDGEDERAPIVFRSPRVKHLTILVMPVDTEGGVALWDDDVPEWEPDNKIARKGAA